MIKWQDLKPHVPLSPGSPEYVLREDSAGEEIARWILANRSPLLLGGPAGVGKSTELAYAAERLQSNRVACLVQLDRFENMRRLTPDRMRLRIIQTIGYLAEEVLRLPLSASLKLTIASVNADLQGENVTHEATPGMLLNVTMMEVMRLSRKERVTLLIDGLEKVPPGPESLDLFDALASIHEKVELVIVIPWHFAFGPHAETVIRAGERFLSVRALEVEGEQGVEGQEFLKTLLLRRLGFSDKALDRRRSMVGPPNRGGLMKRRAKSKLVADAAMASGGIPRIFLQLMADAASYAELLRADNWPIEEDLWDACRDQADTFRRLLLPGDTEAARTSVGTDGRELALGMKIRLMAHGILLERIREEVPVLELHPLVQTTIVQGGRFA